MDESMETLYKNAQRFDESPMTHSAAYQAVANEQWKLRGLLVDTFGPQIEPLLAEYTGALYEEMELESRHFFQQGYRAAAEGGPPPA